MGEIADLSFEDDYQCECGEYLTSDDIGGMCYRCRRKPGPLPVTFGDKVRRLFQRRRQEEK